MAPTAGTRLRFKQAKSKKQHAPAASKKIPSLKNRIRALDRFLKRGGLDDATRAAKQRELKELQEEHEQKNMTEQEKLNAEKYKKFRFVERVKLMRKLKQAEAALEAATEKKAKRQLEKDVEHRRQELLYVFYYPKVEPYIALFPAKPHDDDKLQRQSELRAAAIARFEQEQPRDAFHQFCYNDAKTDASRKVLAAPTTLSSSAAAELLLKRPSKEEQKRKSKKPQRKKDKKETPVVSADRDDDDNGNDNDTAMDGGERTAAAADAHSEDEPDDFFL